MGLTPNPDTAEGSGRPGGADISALVAESTRVPDLPGLLRKRAVVGPDDTGHLTSDGTVVGELQAGTNHVGWSLLGWGLDSREFVRIRNRPFTLQLSFFNLLSKGYDSLDSSIHLTTSIASPSMFHSSLLRGRDSLYSSQLASMVAATIDDHLQVRVAETDGESLRHDQATQERLKTELEPHLNRAMEERGLHLESIDLVAFHNPEEANELLDELSEAESHIQSGVKPGREDVQRLLTRLTSTGLATPEMAERAQLTYDGGTADAFFAVMRDIGRSSRRRLEAQVADRSEQLSQKVHANGATTTRTSPSGMERLFKLIGPVSAIVGLVYKFIPDVNAAWYGLIAGLAVGFTSIIGYLVVRLRRLTGRGKSEEIVIRLDRWVKKNSMDTDDLIRRQMGRELTNTLADINAAKLAAFKQEKKAVADALTELENRTDLVRTEVESAPAASTIVSAKNFPTKRIARMVSFEEDLLRQARNLSIRSQTAKESLADEDVAALGTGLDSFQRTLSKRLGFLEGFKEL